jgi:hypothetical protein
MTPTTKQLADEIRKTLTKMGAAHRFAHLNDEKLVEMAEDIVIKELTPAPNSSRH